MDLRDKTIVITGAAQGLGQKMAESVAACGANVAPTFPARRTRKNCCTCAACLSFRISSPMRAARSALRSSTWAARNARRSIKSTSGSAQTPASCLMKAGAAASPRVRLRLQSPNAAFVLPPKRDAGDKSCTACKAATGRAPPRLVAEGARPAGLQPPRIRSWRRCHVSRI
jgi:hypothetical protein